MISCLILYNASITSLAKYKMLHTMIHEDDIEENIVEDSTVFVYINNIEKDRVWQTVMELEMSDISVGYGFGEDKKDAKTKAEARLELIISETVYSLENGSLSNDVGDEF